jgi:hypothetical protein
MSFLDRVFGKGFAGRKGLRGNHRSPSRKQNRRLTMEQMEQRMMMSGLSLTATPYSASQINLAWTGGAEAATYQVDEWKNGAWQKIDSERGDVTSYAVKNLSANSTYAFKVEMTEVRGTMILTSWSNSVSATTWMVIDHPTAAAPYSNVKGTLFGLSNEPSYLDVQQGSASDCWLMASLAEVAARDPQDIVKMFTWDGNDMENGTQVGIYTVHLVGLNNNAPVPVNVVVDTELPGGGATYAHVVNGVLWAALAEKAYVEANSLGFVTTQQPGKDTYNALNGGDPSWALQAITGGATTDSAINPNNPSSIAQAWNSGKLIVLDTSTPTSSYIVSNHAYAMVGYNVTSYQPFEIYNPWGDSNGWAPGHSGSVYGLFTANSGFLSQNFCGSVTGIGAAAGNEIGGVKTRTHLAAEAALDLVLAGWGT